MRLALEKGELDFAFKSFNPSDINDLQKSSKINTIRGQGPYIRYVCFQCNTPPFNDKIVRQGVAAALNRPAIIKKVFLGQNEPLYSMVPMGMWTHTDNFKTTWGDGNIAKAKELLASRGFNSTNKLTFDFWYTPSHYGDTEVDMAAVIKAQLEATGVMDVTVKSAEWATYKQQWKDQLMPVYLLGCTRIISIRITIPQPLPEQPVPKATVSIFPARSGMVCLWTPRKVRMRTKEPPSTRRFSRCGPMKFPQPRFFRDRFTCSPRKTSKAS
jgi:ABC-type transport system substrate-binding protein